MRNFVIARTDGQRTQFLAGRLGRPRESEWSYHLQDALVYSADAGRAALARLKRAASGEELPGWRLSLVEVVLSLK